MIKLLILKFEGELSLKNKKVNINYTLVSEKKS